jgi:hypothetical protein
VQSVLLITSPASGLTLLSAEERRAAAGIAAGDASQDAALAAMDLRAAAAICEACDVAAGVGRDPTLLRETVTETFRHVRANSIILSRRHDIAITSVTLDGSPLGADDYDVDPESGILRRLDAGHASAWCASIAVIVYAAGFSTVPQALKNAAAETLTAMWRDAGRDPYVKGTTIEVADIETVRTDLWSGSLPGRFDDAVPPGAMVHLGRFRNVRIA